MANLKILHLLSNWKWTEISEPAVDLALAQKALGMEVEFVCGRGPDNVPKRRVDYNARLKKLESIHVLEMPKHFSFMRAHKDLSILRPMLRRLQPDVIHCHKRNAHLMALLSRGFSKPPVIVRSCFDPEGPEHDVRSRLLYRFGTEGMVVINDNGRDVAERCNGLRPESVQTIEPGIDLDRFSPRRKLLEDPGGFELKSDCFVIGMVSRIRESRRIDIALRAIHALAPEQPQLQLLLVGRGRPGAMEKVVENPAREMGIRDRIVLAGYCEGERLVAAYRAMNLLVYTSPGSDQSCRTVREAMAAGLPVVAPAVGFLPELIEDGVTGKLMALSWESLAEILGRLIEDEAKVRDMGQRALTTAVQRFSPELQAQRTLDFYEQILNRFRRSKTPGSQEA
jgi:glycosyltransferase involved in cell wall biosynthesis